jgi:hypothetical protein
LEATAIYCTREEAASHEAMRSRLHKMSKQAKERAPEKELKVTIVHRMRHKENGTRQNWIRGRLRWFDKDEVIHRMQQEASIHQKVNTTVARSWNPNSDWAYEFDFRIYKSQLGDPLQNEEYVSLWKNSVPELKKPSFINQAGAVDGEALALPSGKDSPKLIECKRTADVVETAEGWLKKYELVVRSPAGNSEAKMLPAVVKDEQPASEPPATGSDRFSAAQTTGEQFINYAREALRKRAAFSRPSSEFPKLPVKCDQSFQVMHR